MEGAEWRISLPSSMHVIPNDQTSTLPSYCPSSIARITSGAILGVQTKETNYLPRSCHLLLPTFWQLSPITTTPTHQYGVPTKELAGAMMDAEPKSPSFTKPGSDSRMFPAFTSLPKKQSTGIRHASQEGWVGTIAPSSKKACSPAKCRVV